MVFAFKVVDGEAPGDRLLVERQRIALDRVHFARLGLALRADDRLHIRQFQQVAQLGRIENVGRGNHDLIAVRVSSSVTARTRSPSVSAATGM